MIFFTWVLLALVVYRLAELIAIDQISQPIRAWVGRKASVSKVWKFIADLIHCPFCLGIWLAFPAAFLLQPIDFVWFFVYWISLAGAQTFLESFNKGREADE